ncbi:MAG: efflux RND transporter periplasmic adaptor subunit, partial [Synechococcales bacterium]|nr:efflux RND transporter periplasmic adaptor subunit [Synechococcales bacterium]
ADLRFAQKNLIQQQKIAETEIREAKAALAFAQERAAKDRILAKEGALPTRQALESETRLTAAQAVLTKAESRLAVIEASTQLQRARAAVEVANSRVSLSDATYEARLKQLGASANADGTVTVTAPIAGIVADREASVGQSAQDAGAKLLTIVDSRTVLATANIYEKDLSSIQEGQAVRVTIAGLQDQTFQGRITVIGTAVNGETRVVPVKAELDNHNGQLKPGMFANIELATDQSIAAAIAIPKQAILEIQGKSMVYVENGQQFEPVEVQTGATAGDLVEIKDGLLEGDKVVVQRAQQLYAQSLRGGDSKADSHDHPPENASQVPGSQIQSTWPWPLILSTGGATALTVGVFWAGSVWGRRKAQQPSLKPEFQQATYQIHEFHPEYRHFAPPHTDASEERVPEPIVVSAEED